MVRFPKILVVDDDRYILRFLRMNLVQDGFDVRVAADGSAALEQLSQGLPDLAIVDLLLPDMHGFELCRKIKSFVDVPIVVLTAVGSEESAVEGIESYAEDYIVKPFRYRELLARLGRVLKRTQHLALDESLLCVCPGLSLDFARHLALVGDHEVSLSATECRLLTALARRVNQFVPLDTLFDEVWPDGDGDELRLKVAVHRLRQKIERPPIKRCVVSARGRGYCLSTTKPTSVT